MGFPNGFVWGAATAAYQVEGGAFEDGKGRSIWDDFSHTPGKVYGGHTGDVACDHYHRFREDVALMASLGVRNYRFSVSWPRVMPEGTGAVNEAGLAFYDALIDALLERGIRPLLTLFHWDLPSALEQRGGWLNPDAPRWFADYAALIARRYGDRVKDFFTFNEPQCIIGIGYVLGEMAPGLRRPLWDTVPMSHRLLLAHGLAAAEIRAQVPDARIGFVGCGSTAIPASDTAEDREAARQWYFTFPKADPEHWAMSTAWWGDPVYLGQYPEDALRFLGTYLPRDFERDLPLIHQPLTYCAHNYYEGTCVRADGNGGFAEVPWPCGASPHGRGLVRGAGNALLGAALPV